MQIVRATIDDVEKIAPLFDQYRQFYKYPSDLNGARRFLRERLQNAGSVVFLALADDGVALGFTQLYPSFSSTTLRRLWILNDLFVVPSARKSGVASALMERARQWGI